MDADYQDRKDRLARSKIRDAIRAGYEQGVRERLGATPNRKHRRAAAARARRHARLPPAAVAKTINHETEGHSQP